MWIEHDGKGAPDLPRGTKVNIRTRDGFEDTDVPPVPFNYYLPDATDPSNYWLHDSCAPEDQIVAYRVVSL